MWTAHVVRNGVAALDQLDGVQQPRDPQPLTHGVKPTASGPAVGHGTKALQEMATARPTPRSSPPLVRTGEPRISTRGAVGVFLGALLLLCVGVYLFHEGALTVDTTPAQLD